jgi:hypothetical protein
MTKLWTGHESVTDGLTDGLTDRGRTDGRSLFLYPPFFFEKAGDNKERQVMDFTIWTTNTGHIWCISFTFAVLFCKWRASCLIGSSGIVSSFINKWSDFINFHTILFVFICTIEVCFLLLSFLKLCWISCESLVNFQPFIHKHLLKISRDMAKSIVQLDKFYSMNFAIIMRM